MVGGTSPIGGCTVRRVRSVRARAASVLPSVTDRPSHGLPWWTGTLHGWTGEGVVAHRRWGGCGGAAVKPPLRAPHRPDAQANKTERSARNHRHTRRRDTGDHARLEVADEWTAH